MLPPAKPFRIPRRADLLGRSALCGVLASGLWAAAVGRVHALPVLSGTTPQVAGGAAGQPVISSNSSTVTVATNASRTLIDWTSYTVNSGEAVNYTFNTRSDIVLNVVGGGNPVQISGAINATVGSNVGGNVWFSAPGGVIFGSTSTVNVGGLLATTTTIAASDFLNTGSSSFPFAFNSTGYPGGTGTPATSGYPTNNSIGGAGGVTVEDGATIQTHGGLLALIAPFVNVQSGATVSALDETGPSSDNTGGAGSVLYGAANAFIVTLATQTSGDLDMLQFEISSPSEVTDHPLLLQGATQGANVYMASLSGADVGAAVIDATGSVTATQATAGQGGEIILSTDFDTINAPTYTGGTFTAGSATNTGTLSTGAESLEIANMSSGRDLQIYGDAGLTGSNDPNSATLGTNVLNGGGDVTIDIGGGSLVLDNVIAGGSIPSATASITSSAGAMSIGSVSASGNISLTGSNGVSLLGSVPGASSPVSLQSTGGDVTIQAGGGISLTNAATASGTFTATSTQTVSQQGFGSTTYGTGAITATSVTAGGAIDLEGSSVYATSLTSTGAGATAIAYPIFNGAGDESYVDIGTVEAAGDISLDAKYGYAALTAVKFNASGQTLSITTGDVSGADPLFLGYAQTAQGSGQQGQTGNIGGITFGTNGSNASINLSSAGPLNVYVDTGAALNSVAAGGGIYLNVQGALTVASNLSTAEDINVIATGSVSLQNVTSTAGSVGLIGAGVSFGTGSAYQNFTAIAISGSPGADSGAGTGTGNITASGDVTATNGYIDLEGTNVTVGNLTAGGVNTNNSDYIYAAAWGDSNSSPGTLTYTSTTPTYPDGGQVFLYPTPSGSSSPPSATLPVQDPNSAPQYDSNGSAPTLGSASSLSDGNYGETVTLNAKRTLIDWTSYVIGSGGEVDYVFTPVEGQSAANARGNIVLNRITGGGPVDIEGVMTSTVSGDAQAYGGNVWFSAPGGIVFGSGAVVNVGGLLATTASFNPSNLTSQFLDPTVFTFTLQGAGTGYPSGATGYPGGTGYPNGGYSYTNPSEGFVGIDVESGAQIDASSSFVGLLAPYVEMGSHASVVNLDSNGDGASSVLYAAAPSYTLTLTQPSLGGDAVNGDGHLDFGSLALSTGDLSGFNSPLDLEGTTTALNIYVAALTPSEASSGPLTVTGPLTAVPSASGVGGEIILSDAADTVAAGQTPTVSTAQGVSSVTMDLGNVDAYSNLTILAGGIADDANVDNQLFAGGTMTLTTQAGGDITLANALSTGAMTITAPSDNGVGFGSLQATSLSSDFTITVNTGGVSVGTVTASGVTINTSTLQNQGSITIGSLNTTSDASLTANGDIQLTTVSVGRTFTANATTSDGEGDTYGVGAIAANTITAGGDVDLEGSSIAVTSVTAQGTGVSTAGTVTANAYALSDNSNQGFGSVDIGSITARGNITLGANAGYASLTSVTFTGTGQTLDITANGFNFNTGFYQPAYFGYGQGGPTANDGSGPTPGVGSVTGAGTINISSNGDVDLNVAGGSGLVTLGAVTAGSGQQFGVANLTADALTITGVVQGYTGVNATARTGDLNANELDSYFGDVHATATQGSVYLASTTANDVYVTAAQTASVTSATTQTTYEDPIDITGATVFLGTGNSQDDINLTATNGNATAGDLTAQGAITISATNGVASLHSATAGTPQASYLVPNPSPTPITVALTATGTGADVLIGGADSSNVVGFITGATSVTAQAARDVTVDVDQAIELTQVSAGRNVTLTAPSLTLDSLQGALTGNIGITVNDDAFTFTSPLTAGGGVNVIASGALALGGVTAEAGSLTLAGSSVSAGATTASGSVLIDANAGAVTLASVASGGAVNLDAPDGAIAVASTLQANGGDATLQAGGAVTLGGAATSSGGFTATSTAFNSNYQQTVGVGAIAAQSIVAGGAVDLEGSSVFATAVTAGTANGAAGTITATAYEKVTGSNAGAAFVDIGSATAPGDINLTAGSGYASLTNVAFTGTGQTLTIGAYGFSSNPYGYETAYFGYAQGGPTANNGAGAAGGVGSATGTGVIDMTATGSVHLNVASGAGPVTVGSISAGSFGQGSANLIADSLTITGTVESFNDIDVTARTGNLNANSLISDYGDLHASATQGSVFITSAAADNVYVTAAQTASVTSAATRTENYDPIDITGATVYLGTGDSQDAINLTATNGNATAGDLTAQGAITISAANGVASLHSATGATPAATYQNPNPSPTPITVALTATGTGGDVSIGGANASGVVGFITGATSITAQAARDVTVDVSQPIELNLVSAGRNATLTAPSLTLDSLQGALAGSIDIAVTDGAFIFTSPLTAGGGVDVSATGAVSLGDVTSGPGSIGLDGASVTAGALVSGGGITLTALSGDVSITSGVAQSFLNVVAEGSINANALTAGSLSTGAGSIDLRAGLESAQGAQPNPAGSIDVGTVAAGDDVSIISAPGGVTIGSGETSANYQSLGWFHIVGYLTGPVDAPYATTGQYTATVGPITIGPVTAGSGIVLQSSGALKVTGALTSGGQVNLQGSSVMGGSVSAGAISSDGASLFVDATSGAATLGDIASQAPLGVFVTAAGALTVGDVTSRAGAATLTGSSVSAGAVSSGSSINVTANAGGFTDAGALTAGGDVGVTAQGDISMGAISASGGVTVRSLQGALVATGSVSGNGVELDGLSSVQLNTVASGASIEIDSEGSIVAGNLAAGAPTSGAVNGVNIRAGLLDSPSSSLNTSASITVGAITAPDFVNLVAPGAVSAGDVQVLSAASYGNIYIGPLQTGYFSAPYSSTSTYLSSNPSSISTGSLTAPNSVSLNAQGNISTDAAASAPGAITTAQITAANVSLVGSAGGVAVTGPISASGNVYIDTLTSAQITAANTSPVGSYVGAISVGSINAGGSIDLEGASVQAQSLVAQGVNSFGASVLAHGYSDSGVIVTGAISGPGNVYVGTQVGGIGLGPVSLGNVSAGGGIDLEGSSVQAQTLVAQGVDASGYSITAHAYERPDKSNAGAASIQIASASGPSGVRMFADDGSIAVGSVAAGTTIDLEGSSVYATSLVSSGVDANGTSITANALSRSDGSNAGNAFVDIGSVAAPGNINLNANDGYASLTSASFTGPNGGAGQTLTLSSNGSPQTVYLGYGRGGPTADAGAGPTPAQGGVTGAGAIELTSNGAVSVNTTGAVSLDQVNAVNAVSITADSVSAIGIFSGQDSPSPGANISVTARTGGVNVYDLESFVGPASLTAPGAVTVTYADSQGLNVSAGGLADINSVGTMFYASTGSSAEAFTASPPVQITGAQVILNQGYSYGPFSLTATNGSATIGDLEFGGGAVSIRAVNGSASLHSASLFVPTGNFAPYQSAFPQPQASAISVTASGTGANVVIGGPSAANDVMTGLGFISGAASLTATATQDVTIDVGGTLSGASVAAGRDVTVSSTGALALTSLSVGRDLSLTAPSVAVAGVSGQTTGQSSRNIDIDVTGGGFTDTGALTANGGLTVSAAGPVTLGAVTALGGNVDVSAQGAASVGSATASGNIAIAATGGSATLGSATLGSATLAGGGVLSISATGATSDVVLGQGGGAVQGAAQVNLTAGRDVTVAVGGDIALTSVQAGGDLSVTGSSVTLGSVTAAGAAQITASGLAITTLLSAPTVSIEARNGALTVGGAAAPDDGSLWISAAAFDLIHAATTLDLYAGSTAGTARGGLVVSDLSIDPALTPNVNFLAAPGQTVSVTGAVVPTVSGGALAIGSATDAAWTPSTILISGSLGAATRVSDTQFTGVQAFQQVTLSSSGDVLIGSPNFFALIQATPAADIDIALNQPSGVTATGSQVGHVYVAADQLTVDATGKVVQQNSSGSAASYAGLYLLNGVSTAQTALSIDPPSVVDLFGSFVNASGVLTSGAQASRGTGLQVLGLATGTQVPDNYRFNGCVISPNAACGVTVGPEQGVQLLQQQQQQAAGAAAATSDPKQLTQSMLLTMAPVLQLDQPLDPLVTGVGNEEIWRSRRANEGGDK